METAKVGKTKEKLNNERTTLHTRAVAGGCNVSPLGVSLASAAFLKSAKRKQRKTYSPASSKNYVFTLKGSWETREGAVKRMSNILRGPQWIAAFENTFLIFQFVFVFY